MVAKYTGLTIIKDGDTTDEIFRKLFWSEYVIDDRQKPTETLEYILEQGCVDRGIILTETSDRIPRVKHKIVL